MAYVPDASTPTTSTFTPDQQHNSSVHPAHMEQGMLARPDALAGGAVYPDASAAAAMAHYQQQLYMQQQQQQMMTPDMIAHMQQFQQGQMMMGYMMQQHQQQQLMQSPPPAQSPHQQQVHHQQQQQVHGASPLSSPPPQHHHLQSPQPQQQQQHTSPLQHLHQIAHQSQLGTVVQQAQQPQQQQQQPTVLQQLHSPQHLQQVQQQQQMMSMQQANMHHAQHVQAMSASTSLNNPALSSPSTSAAGALKRRRYSGAKIQPTRVKKVMQSDEEIGRMVASVPVAIGRAMERFAEKFLLEASRCVLASGSRTLTPMHMKQAMLANPHFAFLEPILKDVIIPTSSRDAYPPQAFASPLMQSPTIMSPGLDQYYAAGPPLMHPLAVPTQQQQQSQQMQQHVQQQIQQQLGLHQQVQPSSHQLHHHHQTQQEEQPHMSVPPQLQQQSQPTQQTPSAIPSPIDAAAGPVLGRPRKTPRQPPAPTSGDGTVVEKRPRGRPRKIKKDKSVEDDLIVDTASAPAEVTALAPHSPTDLNKDTNDVDRLLMPPPMLPLRVQSQPQP